MLFLNNRLTSCLSPCCKGSAYSANLYHGDKIIIETCLCDKSYRMYVLCVCRRSGSGVSIDSLSANLGPNADNYDSSDTDSEKGEEAKVISAKKIKQVRLAVVTLTYYCSLT